MEYIDWITEILTKYSKLYNELQDLNQIAKDNPRVLRERIGSIKKIVGRCQQAFYCLLWGNLIRDTGTIKTRSESLS
jgi:hypothetical protein